MNKDAIKDKLPTGVEIHGNSLRIVFMLDGKRMREKIEGVAQINKNSIKYAANKRAVIINEIKSGSFDYLHHFPNSPRALKYSGSGVSDIDRTVSQAVDMWLEIKAESKAESTIEGYASKAAHVKAYFEGQKIRTLKTADVTRFRQHLIKNKNMKPKTINDVFTPLRGATALSYHEHLLKTDLMERIPNLELDETEESDADPYTKSQLDKIWAMREEGYVRPQVINMFLFTCWTGLSLSEVIALSWEDIDLTDYSVKIQRAYVGNIFKVPKEVSRTREFELLPPAIEIIKDQKRYTYMQRGFEIDVKNRSNTHTKKERIRPVFMNEKSISDFPHFIKKSIASAYEVLLRKAQIRHRGPNQCRHTFASMLITKFVPLSLIATLMGHTSEKMLRKHYATIIPDDRPNTAKIICPFLGLEYKTDGNESKSNSANKDSGVLKK